MNNVIFTPTSWRQYCDLMVTNKALVNRINKLIKDISRNGLSNGIGKPERLKHIDAWSRRINQEHRLIYNLDSDKNIQIIACKDHYMN